MDGCDLCLLLAGAVSLQIILRAKLAALTFDTNPFFSAKKLENVREFLRAEDPYFQAYCNSCEIKNNPQL